MHMVLIELVSPQLFFTFISEGTIWHFYTMSFENMKLPLSSGVTQHTLEDKNCSPFELAYSNMLCVPALHDACSLGRYCCAQRTCGSPPKHAEICGPEAKRGSNLSAHLFGNSQH